MAGRCTPLINAETKTVADGAVTVVDASTVLLKLSGPDVTLIAGFADYPAAIVHTSYENGDPTQTPGTGPYLPETVEVGVKAHLVKNADHTWWGTAGLWRPVPRPHRIHRPRHRPVGRSQRGGRR